MQLLRPVQLLYRLHGVLWDLVEISEPSLRTTSLHVEHFIRGTQLRREHVVFARGSGDCRKLVQIVLYH